jgi:cytochrome c oxidase subunit 3
MTMIVPRAGTETGPDNSRVGTMVFLMAGSMFFAGLIGAYVVLRYGGPVWPPPGMPALPVGIAGGSTAAIVLSSLALGRAIRALRGLDAPGARRWLGAGAGLGIVFLALQAAQWSRLLTGGLAFAATTYGTTFYALTGAHALHAVSGILWLLVLVWRQREPWVPERRRRAMEAGALYWHFVGVIWVILYVVLYLL